MSFQLSLAGKYASVRRTVPDQEFSYSDVVRMRDSVNSAKQMEEVALGITDQQCSENFGLHGFQDEEAKEFMVKYTPYLIHDLAVEACCAAEEANTLDLVLVRMRRIHHRLRIGCRTFECQHYAALRHDRELYR